MAEAVSVGYRELDPHREQAKDTAREYAGSHFGKGDGVRRPVNLIAQAVNILLANLISDEPKHRVRSPLAELRGEATLLELALDLLWENDEVLSEVRQAVADAILGPLGIIRLGMRAGAQYVTVEHGHNSNVSEPYCRRISLDDYSCDPSARTRRELRWEAVRYRIPRAEAIESGIFGRDPQDYAPDEVQFEDQSTRQEAREILEDIPGLEASAGQRSDAADIGKAGSGLDRFALVDTIELWDVFFYTGQDTYTITIPAQHSKENVAHAEKWLLVEKWQGPEEGPLRVIGFCDMPDQVLFKPVVADWRDLHDLAKVISAKLGREAANAKVLWGVKADGEDDAMTVKNKADSGIVRLTGDKAPEKIEVVGVVKELMPLLEWIEREWANQSGNLPLTGGQGSDATDQTATAAQYLQANASQRISDMRRRVEDLLRAIDRHFGWYLTTDPLIKLPVPYRIPGGETITIEYDAGTRRGDFQHYVFDIERYSAVGQDPNVRLKRVSDFLALVLEFIPAIQAGIVSIDGLTNLGRQEFGIENLDELLPMQAMRLQAEAHAQAQGLQPGQPQGEQVPGMNPGAAVGALPATKQERPVDVTRSAMDVGVAA